ncbi:XapX domain-containing protein [Desulforamulus aquiferis]|uniref:DUF1427 family protein n=1 Tax=Desulforamulus aquiferis TaxID=1397668 RepID=A0AAW7ZKB6_9FIRM|nr:DUF1427 family protein [Desulforamulus aquiferis]MDO7789194.1 DUF1427 family protein [Desulforamulus aquiferis]RYD01355.1 hypothetical protein N752_30645 [Desulforamulus aquiferis]
MKEIILSTATGVAVGLIFAILKLPVPAPQTMPGVMGIVGIFIGYMLAIRFGWGS